MQTRDVEFNSCGDTIRGTLYLPDGAKNPPLVVMAGGWCYVKEIVMPYYADDFVEIDVQPTIAEGTAIKRPLRLKQMLSALRQSGGGTVVLDEQEIVDACLALAARGLYAEPTSAHAAAGFAKLVDQGLINKSDETVVILTGSGLKAGSFYADLFANQS